MNAIAAFFQIILWPFKFLISSIFDLAHAYTGNYGLSLVIVSLCITAGTAPLYLLADIWKNKEKRIQEKMARDIQSIKRNFRGQKKFYYTRAARRLYGYKSWHAIRTSFGILLQIPFFFAAYEVLSEYSGFSGVPFLFVGDLSKPDGLLSGVNALPFLMTAINVLSSMYFTGTKSLKANKDLYIMAIVFLFLLYDSPSALLVYWTCNNILSFFKAFLFRHTGLQRKPSVPVADSGQESFVSRMAREEPGLLFYCAFTAVCSLSVFWIVNFKDTFKYCMAASLLASVAVTIIALARRDARAKAAACVFLWLPLAGLYAVFALFRKYNPYISNPNLKLLIVFMQTLLTCAVAYRSSRNALERTESRRVSESDVLQFASVLGALIAFVFVYQPFMAYVSSPSDIGVTMGDFLATTFLIAGIAYISSLAAFAFLPARAKDRFHTIVLFLLLVSLVWSLILRMKTGMLDGLSFQFANSITDQKFWHYALDPVILTALLYAARRRLFVSRNTAIVSALALIALVSAHSGISALRMDKDDLVQKASASADLPPSAKANHLFSTRGANVVFVIADMFNGNYIGRLTERYPEYRDKLDGFTWYPDCLSVSYNTATSFPGMFGGRDNLPAGLNGNGRLGIDELKDAARGFFSAVGKAGYRLTVTNPVYFTKGETGTISCEDIYAYENYWRAKNGYPVSSSGGGKAVIPVMLSIFNSAPWHLKYAIYDDARWIVFRRSAIFTQMRNKAIRDMAYVATLPEISGTTDDKKGLFLYIHNELTHEQYGIGIDGNPIKNQYPDPEISGFLNGSAAFLSAKKEVDLLLDWFDWMKKTGVYDDTIVVVVSDHGNSYRDNGIAADGIAVDGDMKFDVSRANTLLLVKGIEKRGSLAVDETPVSSADIASLLGQLADIDFPGMSAFPPDQSVPRVFSSIVDDWDMYTDHDTVRYRTYNVSGPIFKADSWKRVQR